MRDGSTPHLFMMPVMKNVSPMTGMEMRLEMELEVSLEKPALIN